MRLRIAEHMRKLAAIDIDTSELMYSGIRITGKNARKGAEHLILSKIKGIDGVRNRNNAIDKKKKSKINVCVRAALKAIGSLSRLR